MKKKVFITFIIVLSYFLCFPQKKNEATVLFLLPFHLKEANYALAKSSAEINQMIQFEMMGFWLGAKMALQHYDNSNNKINVIVCDVGTDLKKLQSVLNNAELMEGVNIIIGPFYGSLFPEAAEFAKNHNIIIVNPFSTRVDFVQNNPTVYKLTPPLSIRPKYIEETFLTQQSDYNLILWGDSVQTPELRAFKIFFREHDISFKEIHTLSFPLSSTQKNFIIPFFTRPNRVIHGVHTLISNEIQASDVLIFPEQWLSISELTEDFYGIPQLYYFTNYFVDETDAAVKQFQSDYLFFYDAPAELASYSYQGYDITRYFIDLFFANFDPKEVKYKPLSYKFQWEQLFNGGFENIKPRLIHIKNFSQEEMR